MNPFTYLNPSSWLTERYQGIGASEIAILCHASKIMTPYELWEQKTTKKDIEQSEENKNLMEAGTSQEPLTIYRFLKNRNNPKADQIYIEHLEKKVLVMSDIYLFTEFKYPGNEKLFCHPDLIIKVKNKWLNVEAKFVQHKGYEWNFNDLSENGIPQKHYLQCQFQMMITGIEKTILIANYQGVEFYEFPIEVNKELFPIMEKLSLDFLKLVEKKEPPMPTSRADVLKLFPKKTFKALTLTDELEAQTLIQKDIYDQNKKRMNHLKKANERIKADVMSLMADNNVLQTANGEQIAKYNETPSTKFNKIDFVRDNKKLLNYCKKNKIIIDGTTKSFNF